MSKHVHIYGPKEVLESLKDYPQIIRGATLEVLNDKAIMLLAVELDPENYHYIGESLKEDRELARAAITQKAYLYEHCSESIRKDKKFALDILKDEPFLYPFVLNELKQDRDILMAALPKHGISLKYYCQSTYENAKKPLRDDKEVILAALEGGYPDALKHASPKIRNKLNSDPLFLKEALTILLDKHVIYEHSYPLINQWFSKFASPKLSLECGEQNPLEFLDKIILKDSLITELNSKPILARKNKI